MILTFREILRRAGARLSNTSTSTTNDNDITPKLKDWCNERYERIYESYAWRNALEDTTVTIVASQVEYVFDRDVGKVWAVYDQTNGRPIQEQELLSHHRFRAPFENQTGNIYTADPTSYYQTGLFTIKAEIGDTAEKITVVSSNVADLTPNVVHIKGLVNSVELSEDIVVTGATDAESTNTYDASQKLMINVGTSDATRKTLAGIITVTGSTSATVFAKIAPSEYAPQYKWFNVAPTPKASGTQPTWLVWYSKRIQYLVSDNDIPIIDIGNALVHGIVADGLREDGQDSSVEEQLFAGIVSEKKLADTGPNLIEQFVPRDTDATQTGDFGRTWGGY